MPSSTSSFKREVPGRIHLRHLFLGILISCVLLISLELCWRSLGYVPSIVDDFQLWSYHRDRIAGSDEKTVVLLGGSRIQVGFSLDTFRQRFPDHTVIQLAIDGMQPLQILKDLAEDEAFRGIALCSVNAYTFSESEFARKTPHLEYYKRQYNLNALLNRKISTLFQSGLVLFNPIINMQNVLMKYAETGKLPSQYMITDINRSRVTDYSRLDLAEHRAWRMDMAMEAITSEPHLPPVVWLKQAMRINEYVRNIQSREGNVVFIRYPTSDERYELDEEYYPQTRYWDVFAEYSSAETVHFMDYPSLCNFNCPDTSHLDTKDVIPFTSSLLDILEGKGVISQK